MKIRPGFIYALSAALAFALLTIVVEPMIPHDLSTAKQKTHQLENLRRAHALTKLCKRYAAEHGEFPPTLEYLLNTDLISLEDWRSHRFIDFKTKQPADWLYFPAAQGEEPLIRSPSNSESRSYVAAYPDGSAAVRKNFKRERKPE